MVIDALFVRVPCSLPAEEEERDERRHAGLCGYVKRMYLVKTTCHLSKPTLRVACSHAHTHTYTHTYTHMTHTYTLSHLLPLLHVLDKRSDHQPQGGTNRGQQRQQGEEEEVAAGVEGLPEHVRVGGVPHQEEDGRGEEDGVERLQRGVEAGGLNDRNRPRWVAMGRIEMRGPVND